MEEGQLITFKDANQWKLIKVLGKGSFGEVWMAKSTMVKNQKVAIKFEDRDIASPQLTLEWYFYNRLGKHEGIPVIHCFLPVPETGYHCFVMQFLGKSLDNRLELCGNKFSVKTTLQIVIKILDIIEYVHDRGIIHRDIKPDNFVFGDLESNQDKRLYIIDFGLAKEYRDETGRHVPKKAGGILLGTIRYMSINAHMKVQQSRKDDLEAVAYMVLYMLRGNLPWEGIKVKDRQERNKIILEKKASISIDDLTTGIPPVFATFLRETRSLRFEQRPEYDRWRKMFTNYARDQKIRLNDMFDWDACDPCKDTATRDTESQGLGYSTSTGGKKKKR